VGRGDGPERANLINEKSPFEITRFEPVAFSRRPAVAAASGRYVPISPGGGMLERKHGSSLVPAVERAGAPIRSLAFAPDGRNAGHREPGPR